MPRVWRGSRASVSEPRLTSHKGQSPDAMAGLGIPEGFVRLSCGIEDAEDLIADLEQALSRTAGRSTDLLHLKS